MNLSACCEMWQVFVSSRALIVQ